MQRSKIHNSLHPFICIHSSVICLPLPLTEFCIVCAGKCLVCSGVHRSPPPPHGGGGGAYKAGGGGGHRGATVLLFLKTIEILCAKLKSSPGLSRMTKTHCFGATRTGLFRAFESNVFDTIWGT